ncbi:hypothetical protein DPMN_188203 [Dreissena polymorpha]|uniref:Uncharacterized protein n=1 Tax=Dreissena polymorpha TaxID=45954 RepID=A0A9D4IB39_DREPO|nr:hypothetical protein DPMN_188203 [Dreissena polymorpha]
MDSSGIHDVASGQKRPTRIGSKPKRKGLDKPHDANTGKCAHCGDIPGGNFTCPTHMLPRQGLDSLIIYSVFNDIEQTPPPLSLFSIMNEGMVFQSSNQLKQ